MKLFERLYLDFNHSCNYNCLFCRTAKFDNKNNILKLKDFKGFQELIKRSNVIDITGYGEMLLHPDFEEIITILSSEKKHIALSTNGSLLNEKNIKLLENSNIQTLNISLNSLDKEIYSILTGGKSLNTVINNLQNVFNSKLKNIWRLQCSFVINNYNFYEIKSFIDFGYKNNIYIKISDLAFNIKDYDPNLNLSDTHENRNYLKECQEYGLKLLNDKLNLFSFDNRNIRLKTNAKENNLPEIIKECEYINKSLSIDIKGNVYPCCWMRTPLGNVKEKSIEEIITGNIYKDLEKNIKEGSLKYCTGCRRKN